MHVIEFFLVVISPIGYKPLYGHDIHRGIMFCPAASVFTYMVADPPADGREGVFTPDGPVGICIALFFYEGDIPHNTLVCGAGVPAGGKAGFLDSEGIGDRLI